MIEAEGKVPDRVLKSIRANKIALKAPITTPIGKGYRSINVRLRQELDLYASVRPVRTLPGYEGPYQHVNLVVVRENTEGLYSGQEHVVVPGVVESLRIVTQTACERIVRYAFELARHGGRRRVPFCHKADARPLRIGGAGIQEEEGIEVGFEEIQLAGIHDIIREGVLRTIGGHTGYAATVAI